MLKLIIGATIITTMVSPAMSQRSVTVRGHIRADGTYVAPHQRTAPNRSTTDNWSTTGNVNPYNGKAGAVDPYAVPKIEPLYKKPRY